MTRGVRAWHGRLFVVCPSVGLQLRAANLVARARREAANHDVQLPGLGERDRTLLGRAARERPAVEARRGRRRALLHVEVGVAVAGQLDDVAACGDIERRCLLGIAGDGAALLERREGCAATTTTAAAFDRL